MKQVHDEAVQETLSLRDKVTALREALEKLVNYTEACEWMLNATPAGQVLEARAALSSQPSTTET